MGQFLGLETDNFFQFLLTKVFFKEFWPIEKERTILTCFGLCVTSIGADLFLKFWAQKLKHSVSFWPQKSLKWLSIISGPRN
jgi:hypothetical protein